MTASTILIGVFAVTVPVSAQEIQSSQSQVITASELRLAGLGRLTDLFTLIDGWDMATVDGFSWDAAARGLSSLSEQRWQVMLDGSPIEVSLFGTVNLNLLPVAFSQIDSVRVIGRPQVHEGRFADAGLIHIYTRRPRKGASAYTGLMFGNETGDPGPFRFTPLASPNVERIGPDFSASTHYANDRGYVGAGVVRLHHLATDEAVLTRNLAIGQGARPDIEMVGAILRAGVRADRWEHRLFIGRSEFDNYFFFRPIGREIPLEQGFTFLGATGTARVADRHTLRYDVSHQRHDLTKEPNALDLDFGWSQRASQIRADVFRYGEKHSVSVGARVTRVSAQTESQNLDLGYSDLRLLGTLEARPPGGSRQSVAVSAGVTGGTPAFGLALGAEWQFNGHSFRLDGSWVRRTREEDGRVWYWIGERYDVLRDANVPVQLSDAHGAAQTFGVETQWRAELTRPFETSVGIYWRRFTGLLVERRMFRFDAADESFGGPVLLMPDRTGEILGWEVAAEWMPLPNLRWRTWYRFQTSVNADAAFLEEWQTVPKHRMTSKAHYRPVDGLAMWAMVEYRAGSRWNAYANAAVESNGRYRDRLGGTVLVNGAIQKSFGGGRVRTNLGFRNLLDQTVRFHPIGASFNLTMYVQGELMLGVVN